MNIYEQESLNYISNNIKEMLDEHLDKDVDIYEDLSESQKKAFELFKKGKNLLLVGEAGMGKCLGIDTNIIMYNGSVKNIQEIKSGDLIMGDDSTSRKVLNINKGTSTMFKIMHKNESYVVNKEHIISLRYYREKHLKPYSNKNIYKVLWFDNKEIKKCTKIFRFNVYNKEKIYNDAMNFLNNIKEILYVDVCIKRYLILSNKIKKKLKGYKTSLNFNEKFIKIDPFEYGYNINSKTKIPDNYLYNSYENRLNLLYGIIKCNEKNSKNYFLSKKRGCFSKILLKISQFDFLFIKDFVFLVKSLGFECIITNSDIIIYKSINTYKEDNRYIILSNINIKEIEKNKYVGFELDGNHRFLIDNFVVTHNSFCIKTFKEYNNQVLKKNMHVTSTTGISAYSIKGVTIHSLLGIGNGEYSIELLARRIYKKPLFRDRIINMQILILDEASMLSAELLEKIDELFQIIRRKKVFFGGVQIILSMDPLQLLPVFNNFTKKVIDERLIIESNVFNKAFNKNNIIHLTTNFRQKNDHVFINLLSRIRNGTFTHDDLDILNKRKQLPLDISTHIQLVTSNKKAQYINQTYLNNISSDSVKFNSVFKTTGFDLETKKLLEKELTHQFEQKGINELILKKNARVMLLKNIDVSLGLVNGALGKIIDIIGNNIHVQFDSQNTKIHIIKPINWELEMDNCKVQATQIPLMLAYSITIHKSQSITLDSAILDLQDCFTDGQVYVALSRVRNLNGIYLKSFDSKKITVNTKMKKFLENF